MGLRFKRKVSNCKNSNRSVIATSQGHCTKQQKQLNYISVMFLLT